MKYEVQRLLQDVKDDRIGIEEAQRTLYVWFGKANSAHCALDRVPEKCCIYMYGGKKDCKTACGHYL